MSDARDDAKDAVERRADDGESAAARGDDIGESAAGRGADNGEAAAGVGPEAGRAGPMSLDDALARRRSVRAFLPREVPTATLREVFALAQLTPSNCNVQPWLPHVVSGPALARLRVALLEAGATDRPPDPDWPADGKYHGVYRDRQYDAAARLYGAMGVARQDLAARKAAYLRNHAFFDAPHAVFIFMQRPFDTREAADIGMYGQTLMLLLTSRGIASCAQGALGLYPSIVRRSLGVADDHRLLYGISFGYEDARSKANEARVGRLVIEDAVRFHR